MVCYTSPMSEISALDHITRASFLLNCVIAIGVGAYLVGQLFKLKTERNPVVYYNIMGLMAALSLYYLANFFVNTDFAGSIDFAFIGMVQFSWLLLTWAIFSVLALLLLNQPRYRAMILSRLMMAVLINATLLLAHAPFQPKAAMMPTAVAAVLVAAMLVIFLYQFYITVDYGPIGVNIKYLQVLLLAMIIIVLAYPVFHIAASLEESRTLLILSTNLLECGVLIALGYTTVPAAMRHYKDKPKFAKRADTNFILPVPQPKVVGQKDFEENIENIRDEAQSKRAAEIAARLPKPPADLSKKRPRAAPVIEEDPVEESVEDIPVEDLSFEDEAVDDFAMEELSLGEEAVDDFVMEDTLAEEVEPTTKPEAADLAEDILAQEDDINLAAEDLSFGDDDLALWEDDIDSISEEDFKATEAEDEGEDIKNA